MIAANRVFQRAGFGREALVTDELRPPGLNLWLPVAGWGQLRQPVQGRLGRQPGLALEGCDSQDHLLQGPQGAGHRVKTGTVC